MNTLTIYIISDGIGGAEQVVWQSINCLRNQRYVNLIVNNEIVDYYSELLPSDRILNIGNIYLHMNPKYRLIRYFLNNRYFSIKSFLVKNKTKKIIEFLKKNELDVIYAHLDYALLSGLEIKKRFNFKLIYTVHSAFGLVSDSSLKPQIPLKNIDFTSIDTIVFVSEYLYRIYKQSNIHFNEHRIIYNGLDNSSFKNFHRSERKNDLFTILFVGGSKYVKGFDLVVSTAEKMMNVYRRKGFRIVVLGTLTPQSEIFRLVKERSLENVFEIVGFVNPPGHLSYFKEADVLFMPSRSEALPIAAIEALFTDLPIVASREGGLPEIIENGENGFMCNLDTDEFATVLVSVIDNYSSLLQSTINHNTRKKKYFETQKMCEKLIECLG